MGTVTFKNSAELNQQVREKMKSLDPSLEKSFNDVMTKSKSYTLLWSLLQTDAEMHGKYEGFGGAVKMATRWMDIHPIYFGDEAKRLFGEKQEKLNALILAASTDVMSGNAASAKSKLAQIETDLFGSLAKDLSETVHNSDRSVLDKKIAKYKTRFDNGDTIAAFEFMADAAKNPAYLNGYIADTVKIDNVSNELLEKGNPAEIERVLARNTPYTILGESVSLPKLDYADIVLAAREKSVKITGTVDAEFIRQAVVKEILSTQKSELLKNAELRPALTAYYENNGFFSDLGRTWLSTAAKVALLSRLGMSAGSGVNSAVARVGLSGIK